MRSILLIISLLCPFIAMADDSSAGLTAGHFIVDLLIIIITVSVLYLFLRSRERKRFNEILEKEITLLKKEYTIAPRNTATKPSANENPENADKSENEKPEAVLAEGKAELKTTKSGGQAISPTFDIPDKNYVKNSIEADNDTAKITPLDEKTYNNAVNYVLSNIKRSDLSVEELSGYLGMSRVHLYKKLKATTGKTPVEFIRQIRLKRGAEMLLERRMTVAEVAFQLGYNNPKYFSRYFREEFGMLPSVYQNNGGETASDQA